MPAEPLAYSPAVRPSEPVSLEAATQAVTVVGGALRGTEAAARTLSAAPGPELQARLAAAPSAERRGLVAGFLQARRATEEAHRRVAAALTAAQTATGPVSRMRALAGADLAGLQAVAAGLFKVAKALRADQALGHLLPPAFGPAAAPLRLTAVSAAVATAVPTAASTPAVTAVPVAPRPTLPLPAARQPLPGPLGVKPARTGPLDDLTGAIAAAEPVHVYTASRTPHLAAGLALAERGLKPPTEPYEAQLIALALGHLFGKQREAASIATDAGTAVATLQRGLLAARAAEPKISATQLIGLAIPLTQLPYRCAPYPVLQDLFPKLVAASQAATGQRLSLVG